MSNDGTKQQSGGTSSDAQKKSKRPAGRRPLDDGVDTKTIEDRTKADIIAAATAEFVRVGFDGASINAIARRTKTSKMMIYYHFDNKLGLYRAVLEASYDRIVQQRPRNDLPLMPPLEALKRYAEIVFDVHLNNPDFVRLVMAENLNNAEFIKESEAVRKRTSVNMTTLSEIVERGVASGHFRPDCDAASLYLVISGLSFQSVSNAATLKHSVGLDLSDPEVQEYRRNLVADVALRYVAPSTAPVTDLI